MQVTLNTMNVNNRYNNFKQNRQQTFTSAASVAQGVGEQAVKSKLFSPIAKRYDKVTDWIAENYYQKFYQSEFAKKFIKNTKDVKNMTTHMSALGATLISGMYTVRTLQNDKLDPEKRKTLAINDVLTWGLSTAGSYLIDAKLANWWNGVTDRFVANHLLDNPKAKRIRTLGDWDPAKLQEMTGKKFSKDFGSKGLDELIEEAKKLGYQVTRDEKKQKVNFLLPGKYVEKINERIDKINAKIADPAYKGGRKTLNKIKPDAIPNIRDFNLDVLKNRRLTTLIDGMGVLKSLFVFGMVYRYLVPVLVMKPANKIGAYMHKKNAEKAAEQNQDTKKA